MTRHARNCTAGAVYTYHEKQKDTQSCGYGTQRMRLGKDAVKDFDCCCLSLQPCRDPVITNNMLVKLVNQLHQCIVKLVDNLPRAVAQHFNMAHTSVLTFPRLSISSPEECLPWNRFLMGGDHLHHPCLEGLLREMTMHCALPDGYLYDKECILEYIIKRKAENARLLKEYEAQQKREAKEFQELALAEERSKAESFVCKERTIVGPASASVSLGPSVSNMVNGKDAELPSFWVPSLTPSAKKDKTAKPKNVVLCPMSGKPIKAKDLIPIKFTPVMDPDEKASLITKKARYKCAVTHDILGNSVPVAALRTSGNIVTMECVEKLLKKDWIDPTNGKPLKESDIVPLQRGGTGYSSTNLALDAKVKKPVMTV